MQRRLVVFLSLLAVLFCLASYLVYQLPPIHERLAWRIDTVWSRLLLTLNPPQKEVFVPQENVDEIVRATLAALAPTPTPILPATPTPAQPGPTATSLPTAIPTNTPTPIPEKMILSGIVHENQQFNNCGPANLAMALSFWGWKGDQRDTRDYLRPRREVDDKNVNPSEMVTFVETETELKAISRVGGDPDLLRRFIAAGFPVLIEKGHQPPKDWWMGHYVVVNGYDLARQEFYVQDSLINQPDHPVGLEEIWPRWWRDFNYVYLIIYPPQREAEVLGLLGPQVDQDENYRYAAQKSIEEIPILSGRDLFFAWFNRGLSLVGLQDYIAAAEAFDKAFEIYAQISEDDRPYRLMWYQAGPYAAYYHTGRYQDVINLANLTVGWVNKPVLEETYFWRGLARYAQGDHNGGVDDLKKAHDLNPNSTPAREELLRLGVQVP